MVVFTVIVSFLRLPEICVYLKNHQCRVGLPIVHVPKCASPAIPDAVATFMPPVPVSRPSGALVTGRTMASAV